MVAYCAEKKIIVMGYSPLGSSAQRSPEAHGTTLLAHPKVAESATVVGKTPGQVLIRFGLQKYPETLVTIPKSSNAMRIASNFDVSDWELPESAMATLSGLECGFRYFISCEFTLLVGIDS